MAQPALLARIARGEDVERKTTDPPASGIRFQMSAGRDRQVRRGRPWRGIFRHVNSQSEPASQTMEAASEVAGGARADFEDQTLWHAVHRFANGYYATLVVRVRFLSDVRVQGCTCSGVRLSTRGRCA